MISIIVFYNIYGLSPRLKCGGFSYAKKLNLAVSMLSGSEDLVIITIGL